MILSATVTFQSMEGQRRAVNAYDINWFQKVIIDGLCCLDNFMAKKKLLRKGYLQVNEAVDPKIINWENIGTPTVRKWFLRIAAIVCVFAVLCISFAGHWYLSGLQKDFNNVVRSDCSAESWYNIDQAWIDETKTEIQEKQGLMNCYCQ